MQFTVYICEPQKNRDFVNQNRNYLLVSSLPQFSSTQSKPKRFDITLYVHVLYSLEQLHKDKFLLQSLFPLVTLYYIFKLW